MASLNTLRTRGGIIVSIVIGISLLAFLLGDLTPASEGFFRSRKMRVGEIAGHSVDYFEFSREAETMVHIAQLMSGSTSLDARQTDQAHEMAWEAMILRKSYMPGFESMGLSVGDDEIEDMTTGVFLSPVLLNTFVNPSTGAFDKGMLSNFVMSASNDPSGNSGLILAHLQDQMTTQRIMSKFLALVTNAMAVNKLEVEQGLRMANNTFSARHLMQPYSAVPDSLVKITNSQIRAYYDKNKNRFRQDEMRGIEYVVFDMLPSQQDFAAAAERVAELAHEFETAEDPMHYAQANSQESPDTRYVRPESLPSALAPLAKDRNAMIGPTLNGNIYTMSRLASTRMMPDTIGARHILLRASDTGLADSIITALRKGADFAALATQYSLDQQTPGGDLGRFAPEQMISEFSEASIAAAKGDFVTATSQYGLHIINVTYKAPPVQKVQIATLTYTVEPSELTEQEIYGRASALVSASAGSSEKFSAAAAGEGLSKRTANILSTDRSIQGFDNARELIRWAFTAKEGAVSTILDIDGNYVVASLTRMRNQGIAPLEDVAQSIRQTLVRKEKVRMISAEMTGETLDQNASALGLEVSSITDMQPTAFFIDGLGVEQQLIGAISGTTETGRLSRPVEGMTGVFLFDVTAITPVDNATPESERVRLETMAQSYIAQRVNEALREESNIHDMRVKFF